MTTPIPPAIELEASEAASDVLSGYVDFKHAHEEAQIAVAIVRAVAPILGNAFTVSTSERPTVVCLCGSTRFSHAFREANLRETLAGRIVLSIGCDLRSDHELWSDLDETAIEKIKTGLDELHKCKIDLADEILVLNVGGYIGDSTRSEIAYAIAHGKPVRWLEWPEAASLTAADEAEAGR